MQLPAKAQVQGEVRGDTPIVLEEDAKNVGALSPGATVHALAYVIRETRAKSQLHQRR